MKRFALPALTTTLAAATALSSPTLAQRPIANPPAGPTTASRPRPTPLAIAVDPKVASLRDKALADETAWTITEGLTTEIGPRPTGGSARQAAARDWAVTKLKAMGFRNVRIEPYTLRNVWERGVETGEVVGAAAQPLRLTALGNSGATPAGGLTAPVVFFPSINDLLLAADGSLRGKIAFVSNSMQPTQDGSSYGSAGSARFVGPNVAARKGAAAIVIRSIGTDHGRGPHAGGTNFEPGVAPIPAAALSVADAENLERLVARGPVTLRLVLTPRFVGDRQSGNVIAEVPGTDRNAGIVLIGGHLDSWELGTGAIDDAAGLGITTAAAKLVMDAGRPRRTIRVVWFGDEEIGGMGGDAYAAAHGQERHATASESDFGADRVWRFETSFPESAKAIGDRLAAALAPLGIVRGTGTGGDGTDIAPIVKLGVAGVDLNQSGLRYFDWHHTPEDTLDRIDPAQLKQNVAAWTTMLQIVANAPEEIGPVPVRP